MKLGTLVCYHLFIVVNPILHKHVLKQNVLLMIQFRYNQVITQNTTADTFKLESLAGFFFSQYNTPPPGVTSGEGQLSSLCSSSVQSRSPSLRGKAKFTGHHVPRRMDGSARAGPGSGTRGRVRGRVQMESTERMLK